MKHDRKRRLAGFVALAVVFFLFVGQNALMAQSTQQADEEVEAEEELAGTGDDKPSFELYGHVMTDAGNSVKAQKAIADISNALGGNPYAAR